MIEKKDKKFNNLNEIYSNGLATVFVINVSYWKNRNIKVTKTQYKVQKKYCEVKELVSNFISIKILINKNIKIKVDTHGSGIPKILNASNALNRKPTKRIEYIIFLFFKIN